MNVMERAKAHYEPLKDEVRIIEVPEWGDDEGPLKIHVWPANLVTRDRIYQAAKADTLESLAKALILRARTTDKLPIFEKTDTEALMRDVDPDVIQRVVSEINEDLPGHDEEDHDSDA